MQDQRRRAEEAAAANLRRQEEERTAREEAERTRAAEEKAALYSRRSSAFKRLAEYTNFYFAWRPTCDTIKLDNGSGKNVWCYTPDTLTCTWLDFHDCSMSSDESISCRNLQIVHRVAGYKEEQRISANASWSGTLEAFDLNITPKSGAANKASIRLMFRDRNLNYSLDNIGEAIVKRYAMNVSCSPSLIEKR